MDTDALLYTDLPGVPLLNRGKIRDIYDVGEHLLIVASDRISAFDVVMPNGIPDKGKILTALSLFWFDLLRDVTTNHVIETDVQRYPDSLPQYADQLAGRSMLWVSGGCETVLVGSRSSVVCRLEPSSGAPSGPVGAVLCPLELSAYSCLIPGCGVGCLRTCQAMAAAITRSSCLPGWASREPLSVVTNVRHSSIRPAEWTSRYPSAIASARSSIRMGLVWALVG